MRRRPHALWWNGREGLLMAHDQYFELHLKLLRAPRVPGLPLLEIDYAPAVQMFDVRQRAGWRLLTDDEIVAVDGLLQRVFNATFGALCGP